MSETSHSPPSGSEGGIHSPAETPAETHVTSSTRRSRRRYGWLGLALIGFTAGAFLWRWVDVRREQLPRIPPPIPVVVAQAEKGNIGVYVTGLGTVTPINTITVTTRVDGQLMTVAYKEGEKVQKDAPLVEIDPRPFQVQLEQAEGQLLKDQAVLQNAKIDLQRYETLITKNAVAQQVLQTQRATVAQTEATIKTDQANVDAAKLNLIYCHITAPITGRIGLRLVDPGNIVSAAASTPMLVIVQTQPISIIFTISEQHVAEVRGALKSKRTLSVDALDRDAQQVLASGELTTLDNQIDPTTGTLRLRATVPNTNEALFPNQFVNARMLVQEKKNVTLVPNAVVQRNAQATFVYVVNPDDSVAIRSVRVGTTNAERSEIVSGIAPREMIVIDGVDRLQAGSKVVPSWSDDEDTRKRGPQNGAPVATSGRSRDAAGTKP